MEDQRPNLDRLPQLHSLIPGVTFVDKGRVRSSRSIVGIVAPALQKNSCDVPEATADQALSYPSPSLSKGKARNHLRRASSR